MKWDAGRAASEQTALAPDEMHHAEGPNHTDIRADGAGRDGAGVVAGRGARLECALNGVKVLSRRNEEESGARSTRHYVQNRQALIRGSTIPYTLYSTES